MAGLDPMSTAELTLREVLTHIEGRRRASIEDMEISVKIAEQNNREDWERARKLAYWIVNTHSQKHIHERRILSFEWDRKKRKTDIASLRKEASRYADSDLRKHLEYIKANK